MRGMVAGEEVGSHGLASVGDDRAVDAAVFLVLLGGDERRHRVRIRSAEDRLFLRFQRTGDPRSLGRLFDRTAADLLRVARYLTGDRTLAEDLVQATFLRAIEGASGYDATRPVLPWLIGILTHQAHDLRRARERATRVVLPPSGADPGPSAAAADAEFRAACVAAMRGLPQPYRDVVGLHLDAGLGAVEIGQRLARPADTVRKQLGRGLGLLRRALPTGFAGAVVVAATSPRVLAAMRDVVTARAAAVGTAVLVGGLAMKKVTMATACLLALGLGALAWWPRGPSGIEGTVGVPPTAILRLDPPSMPTEPPAPRPEVTSIDIERAVLPGSAVPPAPCTIRGRCLDASTGGSLVGVSVLLHWGLDSAAPGETRMLESTTGSDGAFEFRLEAPAPARCAGEVQRAGYVPLTSATVRVAPGRGHDWGDVILTRGCEVRGRVLDTEGRPQAEVSVFLEPHIQDAPAGWRRAQSQNGRTGADGTFVLRHALPGGRYGVRVHPLPVIEPRVVDLGTQPELYLTITTQTLEAIPNIAGIVVDDTGTVVASAQIRRLLPGGRPDGFDTTVRDGRFRILRGERDAEGPFALQVEAEGFQITTSSERYAWGSAGLQLTMPRGVPLTLDVCDADTGAPIEAYAVRWRPHPTQHHHAAHTRTDLRHQGRHPAGRLTFPAWRGQIFVEVVADDAAYAPSEPLAVEVADGTAPAPQRVGLSRRKPTTLRVETEAGDRLAGTEVEVLQSSFGHPVDVDTFVSRSPLIRSSSVNAAQSVARGVTDAAGEVTLALPRDRALSARVVGARHPVQAFRDLTLSDDVCVLRIQRGATLRGRLVPADRVAEFARASVGLRRGSGVDSDEFPLRRIQPQVVIDAASGTFEMVGVPAGTWTLDLTWTEGGFNHAERLAEVGLREAETRDAVFALDAIQFGRVRLEVIADGQPVDGWVRSGPNLYVPLRAGIAEGRVRTGEHAPRVEFHRGPRLITASLRPGFTVQAGELVERRYELSFGTLRLRLVDARGQPVRGARVVGSRPDAKGSRELTPSDADGRIECLDMPRGPYRLRIRRLTLTDSAAESAFLAANRDARREDLSVDLAEVEVTANDAEHRLAVPRAALR